MGRPYLIQEDNQTEAIGHLLDFDRPKGPWRIQRPDGQFYKGYESRLVGDVFVAEADRAADFSSERGAQHFLDISIGSHAGRKRFRGCKPVNVAPPALEDGDHVVCPRCCVLHERDYCPTAEGHGVAQ